VLATGRPGAAAGAASGAHRRARRAGSRILEAALDLAGALGERRTGARATGRAAASAHLRGRHTCCRQLRRQADHHDDRLAAAGLAAGDDVVVRAADLALVGAAAGELAAEAVQREAAVRGPSLVKVPSHTVSARGLSTAKVTERSRPISAPYLAVPLSRATLPRSSR
jgi:hypothetical protein